MKKTNTKIAGRTVSTWLKAKEVVAALKSIFLMHDSTTKDKKCKLEHPKKTVVIDGQENREEQEQEVC